MNRPIRTHATGDEANPAFGISVIVPAYEGWPILHRTLAALLRDVRQLDLPWQVLVVDNESEPPLAQRIRRLGRPGEALHVIRRTRLGGRHFQPGAARNVGIDRALYQCLVFLDADCVPSADMLRRYADVVRANDEAVFIGHRVFVDADGLDADSVARERDLLDRAPRVGSSSNYGEVQDRRLAELIALGDHPRPYDCLFGCNFALHRACLGDLRFDAAFDGFWGYEDIDLGLRLHRAGRRFEYVPEAFAFHQEGLQLPAVERRLGRLRNLHLFERRCPGFLEYRAQSSRAGALPDDVQVLPWWRSPRPLPA